MRQHERSTRIRSMNQVEVAILYDQWQSELREIQTKKEQFLRDSGWDLTCDTPGSLWMWSKDRFLVSLETALQIEEHLRDYVHLECEKCGAQLHVGPLFRTKAGRWRCQDHSEECDPVTKEIAELLRDY